MSGKAVGRNAILPFRPRQLPEIDTVWLDASALLCLPPGYITGITRTIRMLLKCMSTEQWAKIRFCVVIPDVGLAEVDPLHILQPDTPPIPASAVVTPPEPEIRHSRFWYIPWAVRHQLRTAEKGVRNIWVDPFAPPLPPPVVHARPSYPPYPDGSIIGLLDLGPRDLVMSFGGMWVVPNGATTFTKTHQQQQFKHVSLIYDMIPINSPHYLPPGNFLEAFETVTKMQLNESDIILTISEYSKQDILQYAKHEFTPVGPVEVFTLGSDITPLDATTRAATPTQHRRPFVLSVGSIEWRKNHYGMYQAWRKLVKAMGPDKAPDLVMAGKPGWSSEVIIHQIKNDPLVKDKIVVKSGVGDRELDWLYKNCLFTLYPSVYEGWGLPVEESFIYGKMCITTNATSLPEVGGEFAEYIEPDDVDAIVRTVQQCMDERYRHSREELISENYKPNTWQMASAQIQAILKSHFQFYQEEVRESIWRRAGTKASRKMASALSLFW